LFKKANLKENQKILELGCGRGDFINEFKKKGLQTYGIDISDYSTKFFPKLNFLKLI
jgi:ubiquinone/menaquinone biosynthesis C-methylase UbiE